MGIEPTSEAWEASILPLNYARPSSERSDYITLCNGLKFLLFASSLRIVWGDALGRRQSRCPRLWVPGTPSESQDFGRQ
jgi:hypothetical protein